MATSDTALLGDDTSWRQERLCPLNVQLTSARLDRANTLGLAPAREAEHVLAADLVPHEQGVAGTDHVMRQPPTSSTAEKPH